MGPGVAVAEVRNAVRACLSDLASGDLVLVACSGGADSLALAAATAFVAPRLGLRAGGVTVDHGLQPGSGERAASAVALLGKLGLDPVRSAAVTVGPASSAAGPEAAARVARYGALDEAAIACGAAAVLLGHTLDDQAETVLLGLARGSGGRSLAGMAARRGPYRRPLLGVRRVATSAACAELGLEPWQDPHNRDFRFARARVRHQALPTLEAALGPGVAEALARTASQLRADTECLDDLAFAESAKLRGCGSDPAGLDAGWLRALPAAISAADRAATLIARPGRRSKRLSRFAPPAIRPALMTTSAGSPPSSRAAPTPVAASPASLTAPVVTSPCTSSLRPSRCIASRVL